MTADKITPSFEVEPAAKKEPEGARGRGRPKGSTNAARSATAVNADVKQALASLDMLYELVATGLLMWGKPQTATVWASKSQSLRETNENALKAAPKLAKMLATAGSTSGTITFLTTHVVAFGALAVTLQLESNDQHKNGDNESGNDGASQTFMG